MRTWELLYHALYFHISVSCDYSQCKCANWSRKKISSLFRDYPSARSSRDPQDNLTLDWSLIHCQQTSNSAAASARYWYLWFCSWNVFILSLFCYLFAFCKLLIDNEDNGWFRISWPILNHLKFTFSSTIFFSKQWDVVEGLVLKSNGVEIPGCTKVETKCSC